MKRQFFYRKFSAFVFALFFAVASLAYACGGMGDKKPSHEGGDPAPSAEEK